METIISKESLFDGLSPSEQRRLYFLLLLAEKLELQGALALAERIDAFITAKTVAPLSTPAPAPSERRNDGGAQIEDGNNGYNANSSGVNSSDAPMSAVNGASPPSALPPPTAHSGRLDKSAQIEFFKAIAQGATNAELAERFGLTKRQAHALRIGMARRLRAADPPNAGSSIPPASSADTTEVEVIRFLRQVGDVVVREGEAFVVNSILRFNLEELIARANTKRLQRGKPVFERPRLDASRTASLNGTG
jgi:hypothetical protein